MTHPPAGPSTPTPPPGPKFRGQPAPHPGMPPSQPKPVPAPPPFSATSPWPDRPPDGPPPPPTPKREWLSELPYVGLILLGCLLYGSSLGVLLGEWAARS